MTFSNKKLLGLIKDLTHSDATQRRRAAEALSNGDERAIYPLIKTLRDNNPGVQDAAIRSLISIGGETTAYMLLPLLREDSFLRNTAMIILKEIGKPVIPLLLLLLKDKDSDIRKFAIDLICNVKHCDYPEEIASILENDPNPNVRASAAKAIGHLNYKDAIFSLIKALNDDEWVSFSALESISMIKDESAVASIELLLNKASEAVRYAAIESLGKIGSPSATGALLNHLPKTDGFEKAATIKSLVHIGVTPSMTGISDDLIDMLITGEWDDKLIAIKGLINLKEIRAIYPIIDIGGSLDPSEPESDDKLYFIKDALKSFGCIDSMINLLNNPALRYRGKIITIDVMGDLKCKEAVPYLIEFLKGGIRDVRRASIKALGEMAATEEKPDIDIHEEALTANNYLLNDGINDYDGHVRKASVIALGKIGDKRAFGSVLRLLKNEQYTDVVDEAVKTLLILDSAKLFKHVNEFNSHLKKTIARFTNDLDILLLLSHDNNVKVSATAISRLGKINKKSVHKRLTEAIRSKKPEIRRAAVVAMGELKCCPDKIRSALKDSDTWVRLYATKAMGQFSNRNAIKALIPMLKDKDVPVVLSAIDAILNVNGKKSFNILNQMAKHSDTAVKQKVSKLLEGIC